VVPYFKIGAQLAPAYTYFYSLRLFLTISSGHRIKRFCLFIYYNIFHGFYQPDSISLDKNKSSQGIILASLEPSGVVKVFMGRISTCAIATSGD
jgi:hypothetical protein